MDLALFWFLMNALTIVILAFFSMEEMAAVSFNKIRLQFYVSEGSRRAIWLQYLLENPSRLFGTTLIGVNVATFVGSECAREFHSAIGVSPDLAPISQVFLVIILGELTPMFAARRFAEHVALMGVPIIYISSILLSPAIWVLGWISKAANLLFGGQESHPQLFLTQDELQKVLEEHEEDNQQDQADFRAVSSNIFRLRNKTAKQGMSPLNTKRLVPSDTTIDDLKKLIDVKENYFVVYRGKPSHVIGILYIRDVLSASGGRKIQPFCSPPWFISQDTHLIDTLKQFRKQSEQIAIVVDHKGNPIGLLTFDDILDEIFEKKGLRKQKAPALLIDRSFSGSTTLKELKSEIGLKLPGDPEETLAEYMMRVMEHPPEEGESCTFENYELIVKEATLLGISRVAIKSRPS